MILGIQLVGILFGLIMLYLTFLYYKRKNYGPRGAVFWSAVWIIFLLVILFPTTLYGVMETLHIERTVDFLTIGSVSLFAVVIFHLYLTTKKTERKVENLVRSLAIEKKENDNTKT